MSNIKIHTFPEHYGYKGGKILSVDHDGLNKHTSFLGEDKRRCFEITLDPDNVRIETSYFIGVDWLKDGELVIQVEPKIDSESKKTDFLTMFTQAMRHPEIAMHTSKLYDIRFDQPSIVIPQKDDYLTPLLVIHFMNVLKDIVRKGLKQTYNRTERNLSSRVKGKVLVRQTIRQNHSKGQLHKSYCQFDEYSVDGIENRLLKKAFLLGKKYLQETGIDPDANLVSYISPALEKVGSDVSLRDVNHIRVNRFYKEYGEGIELAKTIIRRFGYNINNGNSDHLVNTPPFWIDMSLLFELYVLGLLKDRFGNEITYHFKRNYNELDYLLKSEDYKMVIDAKYKPRYDSTYLIQDIRQLSGYARLKEVYRELEIDYPESIDCLVIYPNQGEGNLRLDDIDLTINSIQNFEGFYKVDVKLPVQDI